MTTYARLAALDARRTSKYGLALAKAAARAQREASLKESLDAGSAAEEPEDKDVSCAADELQDRKVSSAVDEPQAKQETAAPAVPAEARQETAAPPTPADRPLRRMGLLTVVLIALNLVLIFFVLAMGYHNGQLTRRGMSALEHKVEAVSTQVEAFSAQAKDLAKELKETSAALGAGLKETSADLEKAVTGLSVGLAGLSAGLEDAQRGQRENASRFSEIKRQIDGVHRRMNALEAPQQGNTDIPLQ